VAARYPAFDLTLGRPITLPARIDRCRAEHLGLRPQGPDGAEVLALSAWLAHQARGTPLTPPADARLAPWQTRGAQLWQQRLGQLNLSCAQCHDQRAGQRLGGAPIPQAHPTGYPTYRLEWQTLGSLQRRLRGCLIGVRAEPFTPDADEWLSLELYLNQRAAGMLLEGVAMRP
jgi:sulfur-oxidizing protein SoxA